MTEVTLVKRIYALALIAFVVVSASACTREKPADTPVPSPIPQRTVVTPPPVGTLSAAEITATVTATVPVAPSPTVTPTQVVLPPPTVAPTVTPVPPGNPPPASGNPTTYTVQRGDWIYALARRFGVSVADLLAANPGINANLLYPGQQLRIPNGSTPPPDSPAPPSGNTYVVQRGDTLFSIAVRFKTNVTALQIANHLANPNFIYPGQVLTIPQ